MINWHLQGECGRQVRSCGIQLDDLQFCAPQYAMPVNLYVSRSMFCECTGESTCATHTSVNKLFKQWADVAAPLAQLCDC